MTEAGFEAAHWTMLGLPDAPDAEIMSFAKNNGYVVLTHDLDFGAILAATQGGKPSVVQIRSGNVNPDTIGKRVVDVLRRTSDELEEGALVSMGADDARMRLLPLRSRR